MPKDLSTIERIDSTSSASDREKKFPLGSISKSICAAVFVSMALEGKFGENGLKSSLDEVLEKSQNNSQSPEQIKKISEFRKILKDKKLSDTKIFELLNHTAGLLEGWEDKDYDPIKDSAPYKTKTTSDVIKENFFVGNAKGKHNYSNSNYILLEEIINLTADSQSYKQEVQSRIFDRCEMKNSGGLYDSKEREALENGVGNFVAADENGNLQTHNPAYLAPSAGATVALAPGGITSTFNDLEKYSTQLAKMIMGLENLLTDKPQEAAKLYSLYTNDGYSLGVKIKKSESEETIIRHKGTLPSNENEMRIAVAKDGAIKSENSLSKKDGLMMAINYRAQMKLDENKNAKISTAFNEKFTEFLAENYLDEKGILDSKKLSKDFKTLADIDRAIDPILCASKKENQTWVEKIEEKRKSVKEMASEYEEKIGGGRK